MDPVSMLAFFLIGGLIGCVIVGIVLAIGSRKK